MQACVCIERSSRPPKAPPTPASVSRTFSGGEPQAGGDLTAVDVKPLRRHVQVDAAVLGRDRKPGLGPEERLVLHPQLVHAAHDDLGLRLPPPRRRRGARGSVSARCRSRADAARRSRWRAPCRRAARAARSPPRSRSAAPPRRLRMVGGHDRDRLALIADDVRSRAPAGRGPRVRRSCGRARPRGSGRRALPEARAPARSRVQRRRAYGCGLLRVVPQSIPSAHRSDEYANSPFTLGVPSGRPGLAPTPSAGGARRSGAALTPLRLSLAEPHGVEDLLVAGAAAEVPGERLAHDRLARVRIALEQVVRGHDQPGRAEAALHRPGVEICLLDRMQLVRRRPRAPRRSRPRRPRPGPQARGTRTRARRRGRPSTNRTRPAHRRSSTPAGPCARAGRTAGSRPPRRRRPRAARR